jgi:hypothetical protein
MLVRLAFVILAVAGAALTTGTLRAEEGGCTLGPSCATPPDGTDDGRWAGRPVSVVGMLGVGTPVGLAGAMGEWAPDPALVLGVGAGVAPEGAQVALMARGRLIVSRGVALTLGAGVSGGPAVWNSRGLFGPDSCFLCLQLDGPAPTYFEKRWSFAVKGNGEVGIEGRLRKGFTVRGYLGVATIFNASSYTCSGTKPCDGSGATSAYVGAAVGYAFAL